MISPDATSVPSTPNIAAGPPANRRLWSSPAFSDYFSSGDGEDGFSPDMRKSVEDMMDRSSGNGNTHDPTTFRHGISSIDRNLADLSSASQSQRVLLARLNNVAKAILRSANLTEHHCQSLSVDIDRLEQTLSAPDSQTREPADIADSGLFIDDEDEVEETEELDMENKQDEETKELGSQIEETESDMEEPEPTQNAEYVANAEERELTVSRIMNLTNSLKLRYEEMKHIHDLATAKLEACATKITKLGNENEDLRNELTKTESEMRYLKLQQHYLEIQSSKTLDAASKKQLLKDIEQWKRDWRKNSTRQREDRRSRGFVADDYDLDDSASTFSVDSTSVRRLIISRNSSVSFSGEPKEARLNGTPTTKAVEVDTTNTSGATEPAVEEEVESEEVVEKTPWQELWDGLADFAGIRNDLED